MRVCRDSIIGEIIEAEKRRKGKRFRLKKPLKPLFPKPVEREYAKELKAMVRFARDLISEILVAALPNVLKTAEAVRPDKADGFADDIDGLMSGVRIEFLRRYSEAELQAIAERIARRVEGFNASQLDKSLMAVLNVQPLRSEPWLASHMEGFVKTNVKLIKSVSEDYFSQVEGIVTRGATRGLSAKEIGEEIADRFGVTDRRGAFIARDQIGSFNGELTALRQREVGIKRYVWSTSLDERVRTEHQEREGRTFSWDEPPDDGHPGQPIACRCVAIPDIESAFED